MELRPCAGLCGASHRPLSSLLAAGHPVPARPLLCALLRLSLQRGLTPGTALPLTHPTAPRFRSTGQLSHHQGEHAAPRSVPHRAYTHTGTARWPSHTQGWWQGWTGLTLTLTCARSHTPFTVPPLLIHTPLSPQRHAGVHAPESSDRVKGKCTPRDTPTPPRTDSLCLWLPAAHKGWGDPSHPQKCKTHPPTVLLSAMPTQGMRCRTGGGGACTPSPPKPLAPLTENPHPGRQSPSLPSAAALSSLLPSDLESRGRGEQGQGEGSTEQPPPRRQHPPVPEPRGCAAAASREAGDQAQEV